MARGSGSRAASELKAPKGAAVEKPSKNITKAMGEMPIIGKNGRIDTQRIVDGLSSLREMLTDSPDEIQDFMGDLAGEMGTDAAKTAAGIVVDSLEVNYLKQAKELAVKEAIKFGEGDEGRIAAQYDKQIKDAEDAVRSGVAEFLSYEFEADGNTAKDWLNQLNDAVKVGIETSKNMGEMESEKQQAARFDTKRVKVMLNDAYTALTENLGTESMGVSGYSRSPSEYVYRQPTASTTRTSIMPERTPTYSPDELRRAYADQKLAREGGLMEGPGAAERRAARIAATEAANRTKAAGGINSIFDRKDIYKPKKNK